MIDVFFYLLFIAALAIVLLQWYGIRSYTVLSGSMEPMISTGSLVFVNTHQKPEKHDIVTYQQNDLPVTHRITGITKNGYITKGDANEHEDFQVVNPNQIIGVVIARIPFVGYMLYGSRWIVLLLAMVFIFFGYRILEFNLKTKKRGY